MSAIFDFGRDIQPTGAIRLKTLEWQIRDAVFELKKLGALPPFTVKLTQGQLRLLQSEMKDQLSYNIDAGGESWSIHGCKIEVIENGN